MSMPLLIAKDYRKVGDFMLAKGAFSSAILNPVAISDKELSSTPSFTIHAFELCTLCGARFGIGYHGTCSGNHEGNSVEMGEWPKRLTEILAKDHRQDRAHKNFIDLDF
jgi:hypothetical protein